MQEQGITPVLGADIELEGTRFCQFCICWAYVQDVLLSCSQLCVGNVVAGCVGSYLELAYARHKPIP